MMVRRLVFLLFFSLISVALWAQPVSTTRADEQLEDLLTLQRELLVRASAAQVQEDVERLRPRLQDLVFDWEAYLRDYPDKVEGLVGYSMLLGNPLIEERKRAKALLLKANSIDPNLPIVKNQLGKYLAEEGLPLQALPYFIAAADLVPDEPLYHYQIGQLLAGGREVFLENAAWTVEAIDKAMQDALAEAVKLNPESLPYAYRYAESYYDLENPPWDEALAAWRALEERVESTVEKQMMRLHQVNVLLFQEKLNEAETMLIGTWDEVLEGQRDHLAERLDRLRNPPPEPEPTNPEDQLIAKVDKGQEPVFEVPEFQPMVIPEHSPLNAEAMVKINQESTIDEIVGTADGSDIEQDIEFAEDEIEETEE
jgi:tetratricopeptide (TPR) repeat protein